jgi:transcriptional regulator with XRE-family HTH domain
MEAIISHRPVDWREGRRLRAWELKQRGWTQEDLAASSGLSTRSISNIENGVYSVTLDTLEKLAKGFKTRLSNLIEF